MAWWQQAFFQIALPVIVAFAIATWFQSKGIGGVNKRIDSLRDSISKRLDSLEARLGRIEAVLVQR